MTRTRATYLVTVEVKVEYSAEMVPKDIVDMLRNDPPRLEFVGAGTFQPNDRSGSYNVKSGRAVSVRRKASA